MFLHQVCSMQQARVFPPLVSCMPAHLAAELSYLVLHWPCVPLRYQFESCLFQSSGNNVCFFHLEIPCKTCKTFCFLFHQSEAISFHDSWNLIGAAAGVVGVVILSWACFPPKKVFSWALNLFLFGNFSKLYFERKYRCHQVLETRKVVYFFLSFWNLTALLCLVCSLLFQSGFPWIPQCISFQGRTQTITCQETTLHFLLDLFEAFVFENSSFALTLFGKIQMKAIIYQGNVTRHED